MQKDKKVSVLSKQKLTTLSKKVYLCTGFSFSVFLTITNNKLKKELMTQNDST